MKYTQNILSSNPSRCLFSNTSDLSKLSVLCRLCIVAVETIPLVETLDYARVLSSTFCAIQAILRIQNRYLAIVAQVINDHGRPPSTVAAWVPDLFKSK